MKATDIGALVQGMSVSVDVSTGDHDAIHRLFGTVTLVQENQGGKHGLILLVQDPQPNFKLQPEQEQEPEVDLRARWPMNKWKENKPTPPQRKPLTEEHGYLVGALRTIAESTYDAWSNGAQAQRIAIAAIKKYETSHNIKE